jgi:hypothetical protein
MSDKNSAGIFYLKVTSGLTDEASCCITRISCGWKQNMSNMKPSDYQCHKSKTVSIECHLAEI